MLKHTRSMNDNGWIKVYGKIVDWEWYGDPNMVATWLHLLISANWKDKNWRGTTVKRGQLVTSIAQLSQAIGQSEWQTRTCLERLENSKQIIKQTTNKFSIITICNYDSYQCLDESTPQATHKQEHKQTTNKPQANPQATHKQHTTPIDYIDSKINKKIDNNTHTHDAREGDSRTYGTFNNVRLTDGDLEALSIAFAGEGLPPDFLDRAIDKLSAFMAQEGRDYNNHRAAIMHWAKAAVLEEDRKTGRQSRHRAEPQPTSKTAEGREAEQREVWGWLKEEERKEYLDTHDGLTPWQYEQKHGRI